MSTKTTYDFNYQTVTNGFQKILNGMHESKLSVVSKSGSTWINIPLLFALVIALIFPFILIATVVLVVLSIIKISITREECNTKNSQKMIDIK